MHVVSDGNISVSTISKLEIQRMLFCQIVNDLFFIALNMSDFMPKKVLAGNLTVLLKKSAAELHRILVETHSNGALLEITCRDWFKRFKNNDFNGEDKAYSSTPKKFEDEELEALLHEDSCQAQAELAESLGVDHTTVLKCLKTLGIIQKQGNWVPYKLKPTDIEQCLVTFE